MTSATLNMNDLIDKGYWIRKFRHAKNMQTLHLMVDNAIDRHHLQLSIVAAIYLAQCQRERELEEGRLLNR